MTPQAVSSVARQIIAVVTFVFGIVTAAVSTWHIPVAVSAVMTAVGGSIIAVEHYVSDTSTGSTYVTTQRPQGQHSIPQQNVPPQNIPLTPPAPPGPGPVA